MKPLYIVHLLSKAFTHWSTPSSRAIGMACRNQRDKRKDLELNWTTDNVVFSSALPKERQDWCPCNLWSQASPPWLDLTSTFLIDPWRLPAYREDEHSCCIERCSQSYKHAGQQQTSAGWSSATCTDNDYTLQVCSFDTRQLQLY